MTRIVEDRHAGESWLLYVIGNFTAIDSDWVRSIGVAWLFKENGQWVFRPKVTGESSLFFNGIFFIRYTITPLLLVQMALAIKLGSWWYLLFGLFFSVRWSPSTTAKSLFQTGLGYKLNGRLGITLRVQSDSSSAAGVTGPNLGQASGFNYGPH